MSKRKMFAVVSPLGYRVVLSRDRWREIVRFKHPAIAKHLADVKRCLQSPEVIRASAKDPAVHVYYAKMQSGYVATVVAEEGSNHFVVTAYFTRSVKKGVELWKN